MRIGFTAVAIWSSPRHFFRRIEKIIKGKSSFFPDPLKLTTTVATWVVFCSALASITVNERWVVIYLLLAALTTPIWATPPLLLVLFAKDVFDAPQPMMGSTWKIYYMQLSNLEFRPKRSDKQFATLLSYRTYLALDYRLAIWAYVYLTIYFLFALSAFLILTTFILAIFFTGFMSGISIVFVILLFSFGPTLWLLFGEGGNSFFVEPYLQMISNTTPKEHEKQIENAFMREFLPIAGKCLNLDPKPPLRVGRPIDDLFVAKIAVDWQRRRSFFLEEERAASAKGTQEFARFLIARMNMADRMCNCLYLLEMSKFDWSIRASDRVSDLKRMAGGESLEVSLEPRSLLDKEQLRVMLGGQCPPYCVEVFWALWTRQPSLTKWSQDAANEGTSSLTG